MADGILLLHAFPMDGSMWEPQVSGLADLRVLAPNLPGFGGTAPAGDVMTMDAAADYAAAQARAAGLSRLLVCGLSMGGYVALSFWRRHKEMVAGLVLANTRADADDEAGKARRQALADRLKAEGNGFLADSPPPLLSDEAPQELWDHVKSIIRAQPAASIAAASLGMAARVDSTRDLRDISVPTVVITSSKDTLIAPAITSPMSEQIPDASLEVIEHAGHLSNLEAPSHFNELLREAFKAAR